MTFTDDLAGLSRAEQIARVQAVAREHGDELDKFQAAQALSLHATVVTAADRLTGALNRSQAVRDRVRAYVQRRMALAAMEDPGTARHASKTPKGGLPEDTTRLAATARQQWRAAQPQAREALWGESDVSGPPDSPADPEAGS